MRFAVIADVHGNLPALDAVLADVARRGVDRIVNLGDCLSGPLWPRETAERLMALDLPTVRGNHDRWLATLPPERMGRSDRFAFDRTGEAERRWLAALPPTVSLDGGALACHGTPDDDNRYLVEDVVGGRLVRAAPGTIAERLGAVDARLVLCGHSHLPHLVRLPGGSLVLNPGSVGCPGYYDPDPQRPHVSESGSPQARYAVVMREGAAVTVEQIAVDYDHGAAAARAAANGRPEWAEALATGFLSSLRP